MMQILFCNVLYLIILSEKLSLQIEQVFVFDYLRCADGCLEG